MKKTQEEFLRLQRHWYDVLEFLGFQDIEEFKRNELVLKQTAAYPFRNTDAFSNNIKEEYFRILAQKIYDEGTVFVNEIDKYILCRHAEGARIKAIVDELTTRGTPRNRHSVRFIIRRYEVRWAIRTYTPSQLNIPTK